MLSAKTAILLALRYGPAYGRELRTRIASSTHGRARLSEGTLHPALRGLRAARLVVAWGVVPGRTRGGRRRTYYELTVRGVREAEACARALGALAGMDRSPAAPRPSVALIRSRAERVAEVSGAVMLLRHAASREGRRA